MGGTGRGLVAGWLSLLAACGGGGGGGPTPSRDTRATVPVEALQSVSLAAGVPARFTWVHATPPGTVTGMQVDLLATLGRVQVSPRTALAALGAALAGDTAQVLVRVAPGDQVATVCTSGHAHGPYLIGLDALLGPVSAAPATAAADGTTLAVVNSGAYATCLEITSPVDAIFGLSGAEVTVTHDCAEPAADLSGTWTGTWSCSGPCTGQFGGDITLTVTQGPDGRASYVDDGGDHYSGWVCGRELRTVRNGPLETERAVMTLGAGGTAEKRSHYRAVAAPFCAGDCLDQLHRP